MYGAEMKDRHFREAGSSYLATVPQRQQPLEMRSGKRGIKASNALIVKTNYPELFLSFLAALASLRLTQDKLGGSIFSSALQPRSTNKKPRRSGVF